MLEERRKAEVISQELLRYFFNHQMAKIGLNIDFEEDKMSITAYGEIAEPPSDLAEFTSILNLDRDVDLEDYLQGLVGTHHEAEDFSLLGIMTDDAEVVFLDGILTIKLYRFKN